MLGAIAGDIIGSVHEKAGLKTKEFELFPERCRFTDDTVLTVAVAHWILEGGDLVDHIHEYARSYPLAGYGGTFARWVTMGIREPYQSWGNGSAMRVSPVAYARDNFQEVLDLASASAAVTHDHPEGIRGAQATAAAIFLARQGEGKDEIRNQIQTMFGYNLEESLDAIRPNYHFDVSCQGSVPQSLIAFLEAENYEEAVRNAISLGGDADTMACIAGSVAEAYFGVPETIATGALNRLDDRMR